MTSFCLTRQAEHGLPAELRRGLVRKIVPDAAIALALRNARAAGWVPFVVTNGTVEQQERKLRHTGLEREVACIVVARGRSLHSSQVTWQTASRTPSTSSSPPTNEPTEVLRPSGQHSPEQRRRPG
jgi:hypothetical protein